MSAPKAAADPHDPVAAAFDNAPVLEEPLGTQEEQAIREALAADDEGFWGALERFRKLHDLEGLDAFRAFEGLRDSSSTGRPER